MSDERMAAAAALVWRLERDLEALELAPWTILGFLASVAATRIRALPEAERDSALFGFPAAIAAAMRGQADADRLRQAAAAEADCLEAELRDAAPKGTA